MATYTLDGLPLDDPAGRWHLEWGTGIRIVPPQLNAGAALPGRDGVVPALGMPFDPGAVSIALMVSAADHQEMMQALELLVGVLSQRHRLLPLVHDYGGGVERIAMVQVLGSVEPEMVTASAARVRAVCSVPGVFWRDDASTDSTVLLSAAASVVPLAGHAGSTATINDALIQFRGGFSSATITDTVSGDSLSIVSALAASEYLVIDTANWVARKHSADSWALTGGINAITSIESNRGAGTMLSLAPDFSTGAGRLQLRASCTNVAGSPSVTVRARRSYL